MTRRLVLGAVSACVYILLVLGGTLLVLVVSSLIGYLPYSDRPGPGWHSGALGWDEVKFFLSWSRIVVPALAVWGVLLAIVGHVLAALRSPRWFLRSVGGLVGGYMALVTVAGMGWYIAIAGAPVYAAGCFGLLFGVFVLPRLSIQRGEPLTPSRLQWLGIASVTAGFILGTYFLFLAPRYSQQLSLDFVRIEPSEQLLDASLENSSLTNPEKVLLKRLFPRGIARFGMSGMSGSSGGASARMLIVITDRLSARSRLREPRGSSLVYVQSGATWKRYPEDAKLLSDTVELWPSTVEGKVAVKFGIGGPTEFAWVIPRR